MVYVQGNESYVLSLALVRYENDRIEKVKYYSHQIDGLLAESVAEVIKKWESDSCPAMKLKIACDADLDFDLPRAMEGLKTTGLDKV